MSKSKISEANVRDDHLNDGAILIEFTYPYDEDNSEEEAIAIKNWRGIEKYGFKVTIDGCLISDSCRWFISRPTVVNYDASLLFFKDKKRDTSKDDMVNRHGWPLKKQVSHLCHYQNCCSPYHLVIESQWKNLKRNFCGYDGECDCGNEVKCVRTYHNRDFDHNFTFLSYDTEDLKKKIKKVLPDYSFKIRPKDYYANDDKKKKNRNDRINRGKDSKAKN